MLIPTVTHAQTWLGVPRVVDGDFIVLHWQELRLLNIDALEWDQTCFRDQREYRCGVDATFVLLEIIREHESEVVCEGQIRDQYGRPLVRCRIAQPR